MKNNSVRNLISFIGTLPETTEIDLHVKKSVKKLGSDIHLLRKIVKDMIY